MITVAIVGASRRFLAQITRHQNEVKFMSASLQYSNYTGQADFAVPYSIMTAPAVIQELYLKSCNESMKCYEALCTAGSGHDAAGYATPQGLRNVLLISATPYQWKHIISQRVCRRNTDETRIALLKVWKELYDLSPVLFAPSLTGPFCQMATDTLLTLCRDKKHLGATPGIVSVLHTQGQRLNFHPHIHTMLSGGGLTASGQFVEAAHKGYLLPKDAMGKLYRGKFLEALKKYHKQNKLQFHGDCLFGFRQASK